MVSRYTKRREPGATLSVDRPTSRRLVHLAFLLCVACVSSSRSAVAADADAWWGRDKALHFGVSAGLSSGVYALAGLHYEARGPRLLWGAGVSMAVGAGKEVLDATGFGTPSWRDLTWDAIGVATGLLIAWTIDVLARGLSARNPAWSGVTAR
jgi:putative lipoprotein